MVKQTPISQMSYISSSSIVFYYSIIFFSQFLIVFFEKQVKGASMLKSEAKYKVLNDSVIPSKF
jgi:hypothetical protein